VNVPLGGNNRFATFSIQMDVRELKTSCRISDVRVHLYNQWRGGAGVDCKLGLTVVSYCVLGQHQVKVKDTVSEEDEYDEIERVQHSAAANATLRPNGVIHDLVPVFTGQDLSKQHIHSSIIYQQSLTHSVVIATWIASGI